MALLGEKSELIAKIFFAPQAGAAKSHAWTSFSPVARVGPEIFSRYARMIWTWLTFAMQRISVAVHKAVAKELSDALGFSGAVDPRGAPRD